MLIPFASLRNTTLVNMVREDDNFVIHGPEPFQPILEGTLGQLTYGNLQKYASSKSEALIDAVTKESISYSSLLKQTCSLAESMRRQGYIIGSKVSISSENNIQFYIPVIASLYIGAAVAPINHNYTKEETIHTLNISKPRLVFCSAAVAPKFVELKKTLPFLEKIIIIDKNAKVNGCYTLSTFISIGLGDAELIKKFVCDEFDPKTQLAFIMCSSGTTGLPKGVMQTHRNIMVRYMHTIDPQYTSHFDNILGILPFFHGYGLLSNFLAIVLGQPIIVIKRFEERLFLQTIQDYKIKCLWLAPPLIVLLAKSPLTLKYDLSCVKEILSGAAPLGKNIEQEIYKRLNVDRIRQGYGLTEATLAVTIMPIGDRKLGSSGKVVTYMSCKVRDPETGKSLGPGQVGELCLRGPMVMPGYYGNEEATRNSFTSDGWLLTGDLSYYDQDGYFYIVDRLKELIKYKGYQVAPAELEALLLRHPKIKDVGVVGVPDEDAGELPLAFVAKNENANLTELEVIKFVEGRVSSQKRLRGGVVFISEIPKNPSGKILRRELRKMISLKKNSKL